MGLDYEKALIYGQIFPGVTVWQLGDESRFPGLTYIVFPGNVGGTDGLVEVVDAFLGEVVAVEPGAGALHWPELKLKSSLGER